MSKCIFCDEAHEGVRTMPDGSSHMSRTAADAERARAGYGELWRRIATVTPELAESKARVSPFVRRALARQLPAADMTGHKAAVL